MKNYLLKAILMLSKGFLYGLLVQMLLVNVASIMQAKGQYKRIDEVSIRLSASSLSVRQFFNEVERKTPFKFAYDNKKVDKSQLLVFDSESGTVEERLQVAGQQLQVSFRQINHTIDVVPTGQPAVRVMPDAVRIPITGTVTDENGEPIPGATVFVEGTSSGTVTDIDGKFSIEAAEGSVLVFSFIGYQRQRQTVGNQTTINVTLEEDQSSLDEVVVVGYGSQQKVNLTGAISTVNFDDELTNRPLTNASQALGGTASGVWVSQNSGKPGSDGAQIRVRGWGTLNNSNPLIIVDGVEGSFDQLNPNDIENISVLKDAASAAIYGSKAANGVVLITTRMGKRNEQMQVNLNSYFGIQSLGMRYDVINNSAEHMELTNQALVNEGAAPLFSESLINEFRTGNDPYKYPNTDWFKVLFNTANMQEHNVSIRGGSAQTSSFLSFNYLNQEGMVPNTNSQRYGLRANMESNVKDWLTVSGRFNYIRRESEEPYADINYGSLGRVFEMLGGSPPYIAPYTREGRFGSVQAIDQDGNLLFDNRNPLIDASNGLTKIEENILTLNLSADIKLNKHLTFQTLVSSNGSWNLTDRYNTSVFGYTDTGIETITKNYNREGLEINRGQISSVQNNLFSTLNFSKDFNEIHSISAIGGIQLETFKVQNMFSRRTEPPKEGLTQVDAGTSGIQGEGNMNGFRIFSYFGRVNYSLMNKYLFEGNIRADASSRFAKANRWGVFPGFSAGWRLSEEAFIRGISTISNLKIRASWGQLGNQNISGYWPYLTVIGQDNNLSYNFNGSFSPGAAVTALVDQNITWETSSSLDIGIELGVLEDRITLEADYFQKITKDILVQLPIPSVMGGISSPFENVGQMTNNGFEFIVNYNNLKFSRDQLGLNVGLNFTYIQNEVTKFRGGNSPDQLYLLREGFSFRSLYGFRAIGIYQSDAEAQEHMNSNPFTPRAGNVKFEDLNNDGRLNFEDKQTLGNTIPKYTFGISPSFKYKGFDLNLLFQGILGVSMYTQNNFTDLDWENRMISTRWREAWSPENTSSANPSLKFNNPWDNSESSYWVQEINFIKLKNIQLGYSFPEVVANKFGLQKIYLYVNGQNVFTIVSKDYEGYDPERNTFDSGYQLYPIPRIITGGFNLNF